jgi:hypothetical protein
MKILGISLAAPLLAAPLLLWAGPAQAADGPEAVYAKLHRATLEGNVEQVLSHASAQRRAEMSSLPGKEDMVHMAAMALPKTYAITRSTVRGGKAHLSAQGIHESDGPARGEVDLVREKGQWKVDEWNWSRLAQAPKEEAMTKEAAPPPEKPEAATPAPATVAAPSEPVDAPVLRRATAEDLGCVIKPVMTDAELRRCGATPPKYD